MIVTFIILVFIIICLVEVPNMLREKNWRELITFSALLLPAFVLSILLGLDVHLYSPVTLITYLVGLVLSLFS